MVWATLGVPGAWRLQSDTTSEGVLVSQQTAEGSSLAHRMGEGWGEGSGIGTFFYQSIASAVGCGSATLRLPWLLLPLSG
jgi:hypothetical protein